MIVRVATKSRPGAVVPLTALLLIPVLGMVAFSVDVSHMVSAQTELQSAADAAALAGAGQLMDGWVQYYLPGQTTQSSILTASETSAKTYAKNFAGYNGAAGVTSMTLLDSDIEFGYTDASRTYTAAPTYTAYPNTIKVTMRLDSTANGALKLFFGSLFGMSTTNLKAVAAATIYYGTIDSIKSNYSGSVFILPMTYDTNQWTSFLKTGQGPDGTTDTSANGAPQLNVYPSIKFTGNFGQISLDQGNDGASTISGWISNGVGWSDLQNEFSANLLPISSHNAANWDWKGNPGLKQSTVHTANSMVGQLYLMPLFKPMDPGVPNPNTYAAGTGNGSHYYYNVTALVGIKITGTNGIEVQPAAYIDPNAIYDLTSIKVATAPTSSSPVGTTFVPPKLTK